MRALLLPTALTLSLALVPSGEAGAQGDKDLETALKAEARQEALIAKLAPAVAAVSKPGKPGGGSGVIIDPRGYVLTNFHVSGTSRILNVGLNDGRTYRAYLLGIDPGGDIALLKLDDRTRKTWPFVKLGTSDALRPGERVYAMGNPFLLAEDFSPTVTQGVVSGIHRYRAASGGTDLVYGDCIQIDASINPGNSGGPLFSSQGELLGINGLGGFRPDRGRVNVGVGFAASIDQIKNFIFDLQASRQVRHGTMNATVRDEEEDGQKNVVLVDAITRSSKAWKAGLRLGDIVTHFNGRKISTQNLLLTLLSRLPAGRRVTLTIQRPREDGGVNTKQLTFRLEPLWSGPLKGQWKADPRLIKAETQAVLAAHRATKPPQEWALVEKVKLADGRLQQRVTRVRGRAIRVETGLPGSQVVEVYDGRGWRKTAKGKIERLPGARRDALAGQVQALAALSTPGGEKTLSIELTGGELLAGRLVLKVETKDAAGRKRKLYLDPVTYRFVGQSYPGPDDKWIEEAWLRVGGRTRIVRVDDESGAKLEESVEAELRIEPQNPNLFKREGL